MRPSACRLAIGALLGCAALPGAAQQAFRLEVPLSVDSSYSVLGARELPDGTFAVVGGAGGQAFLLRVAADGSVAGFTTFSARATPALDVTSDGGLVLAGEWGDFEDYALIKIDAAGAVSWAKRYDSGSREQGLYSVRQVADSGYVAAGIFTLKTDPAGTLEWSKIHVAGGGNANSVRATSDGGVIVAGEGQFGTVADNYNVVLTKLAADGTVSFNTVYGGDDYDWGAEARETDDFGFVATGWTRSFSATGTSDAFLLRTDASGALTWAKVLDAGDTADTAHSVAPTSDGGFVVTGSTGGQVLLARTDATGDVLWATTHGSGTGHAVLEASAGGYLVAASGGGALVLVRTDRSGDVPGCPVGAPALVATDAPFLSGPNTRDSPATWTVSDESPIAGGVPPAATSCGPPPSDRDGDTVADDADDCPDAPDPLQEDRDADGAGDACDLCPDAPDPLQEDRDADGAGDACDCAPDDPEDLPPDAVIDLRVSGSGALSWTLPPGAATSDVVSATLASLHADRDTNACECLAWDLGTPSHDDARPLVPGVPATGWYYLVAARGDCGRTVAPDSAGAARVVPDCP